MTEIIASNFYTTYQASNKMHLDYQYWTNTFLGREELIRNSKNTDIGKDLEVQKRR